ERFYSVWISRPTGVRLERKQLERVPAFGPSTRLTIAREDEPDSATSLSTSTRCPSGVSQNWPTNIVDDSVSIANSIRLSVDLRHFGRAGGSSAILRCRNSAVLCRDRSVSVCW